MFGTYKTYERLPKCKAEIELWFRILSAGNTWHFFVSNQAAVKAVVASSRLGSASSSHGSIQESQKAGQAPSSIQDGSEGVKSGSEGEEVQGDGAQVAIEGAEAELMKVQAMREIKDADLNAAKATNAEPKALEDGTKAADLEIEEGLAEEGLKMVEEAAAPKQGQENPAVVFGAQQKDAILPEYWFGFFPIWRPNSGTLYVLSFSKEGVEAWSAL